MNSSPHYAAEVPEEHEADHSSVSLAVSTVILALRHKKNSARPSLWLPLVRRLREPYKGQWAAACTRERLSRRVNSCSRANLPQT